LAFVTYNYQNLNGQGNANLFKNVQYKAELTEWHYIYFAYSRKDRRAYGYV